MINILFIATSKKRKVKDFFFLLTKGVLRCIDCNRKLIYKINHIYVNLIDVRQLIHGRRGTASSQVKVNSRSYTGNGDSMIPAQLKQNAVVFVVKLVIVIVIGCFGENRDGIIAQAKTDIFKGAIFQRNTGIG